MTDAVKDIFNPINTLIGGPAASAASAVDIVDDALAPTEDKPAVTAPVPDDLARRAAAERKMQRKYAGAGRAGTMLTGDSKLG